MQAWPLTSQHVDLKAMCSSTPAGSVMMAVLLGVQSKRNTGPWLHSYWAGGGRVLLPIPSLMPGEQPARLCLLFTFFDAP